MNPKVSVIIPCYNYEKYIEQCLMSVLLQKRDFDIEIIVSDDNSNDNSFEIIKRIKYYYENDNTKFILLKNEINLGEIGNTKILLEVASGEYIAYLDADDFWIDPLKLTKQVNFMDNNPDCSMCITGFLQLINDNEYIPVVNFASWLCPKNFDGSPDYHVTTESLIDGNMAVSSSSRFFRNYRDIFKDYFYEFPYSDWAVNFELSFKGKIRYLDYPTYIYRIHDKSLSKGDIEGDYEARYIKRISILKNIYESRKQKA